jgi:hypothetical protein
MAFKRALSSRLLAAGLSDEKLKEKPLTSWRKGVLYPTVKYGSRMLLFLLGYQWVKTEGEASAEAPIVIANHPSWFEHLWYAPPLSLSLARVRKAWSGSSSAHIGLYPSRYHRLLHVYVPSVVGKEDVKKVPLYGTYAKVPTSPLRHAQLRRWPSGAARVTCASPDLYVYVRPSKRSLSSAARPSHGRKRPRRSTSECRRAMSDCSSGIRRTPAMTSCANSATTTVPATRKQRSPRNRRGLKPALKRTAG